MFICSKYQHKGPPIVAQSYQIQELAAMFPEKLALTLILQAHFGGYKENVLKVKCKISNHDREIPYYGISLNSCQAQTYE